MKINGFYYNSGKRWPVLYKTRSYLLKVKACSQPLCATIKSKRQDAATALEKF
jgi:hypothetical protein